MYDLKLSSQHDIEFSDTFDFQLVSGIERVAQQIKIRLKTFLGEWFLDTRVGVPWIEEILIKNPNDSHIKSVIYNQIITVEGVKEIKNIDISFDKEARIMRIQYIADTTYGELQEEVNRIV